MSDEPANEATANSAVGPKLFRAGAAGGATASLKVLVALGLAAMAAFSIAAIGLYAERSVTRELRLHHQERLNELAFQMRYRLDRSMFERFRDVLTASSLETLRTGSTSARREVLERLQETYPHYAWIGLTDARGRVRAATNGWLEGESVAERPWFVGGLTGPFVGDVHEAQVLARFLPAGPEGAWLVDISAPVRGRDGAAVGVLGAHLNWTWAEEVLGSIVRAPTAADGIEVFLLRNDGAVILGPEANIGRGSPCPDAPSGEAVCEDGRSYVIAHAASEGYRTYQGLGWRVLVRQPVERAYASALALRRELLVASFVLILILVFAGAGWFLAAWIAQPLRDIAAAAERMRRGETGAAMPASSRFAEVTSLGVSLDGLLSDLRSAGDSLALSASDNERRERFLAAVVETMHDAVLVNKGGRVAFVNSACVALFGASGPKQLIGVDPISLFHPDYHDAIRERIAKMAGRGEGVPTQEERIVRFDGREVDVEVTPAPFIDEGDRAILVILQDITQRKQTQRQLAHAQRMEAVGHLTGGLAHDFNNLLTVIIGNLDLLEAEIEDRPDARSFAQTALDASLRGAQLTKQLLAFSRRQPLAPKVIELNELVKGTSDLIHRTLGERVEVRLQLATDLWPALADPTQMESAIANLAINARDAMPGGGVLTIATANMQLDEHYAAENAELVLGDYVMLAISDDGVGMTGEVMARVFEPFFTTKQDGKGSGLGLSMVFGFAKQSGGHVKIYSEPGHGTTVRLYVPRASADARIEDAGSIRAAPAQAVRDAIILVVEDKDDVRKVVARQLTELGYRVLQAENAARALEFIESDQRIDLLFTDIVMPGEKTGVDLAHEARIHRPHIPIVFTSGFAEIPNGSEKRARELGPLLSKPYRSADLAEQIARALQQSGSAAD